MVALVCTTALSKAQTPTETSPAAVEVTLVGAVGKLPAFPARVTSWFDSNRFKVSVHTATRLDASSILSPKPQRGVYAWVLLRSSTHGRLYFASASGPDRQTTYLVRDLDLEQGLDEMGAERVAQVLHLSTVALLEGQAATRREDVVRVLREEPEAQDAAEEDASSTPPGPHPAPATKTVPHANGKPSRGSTIDAELAVGYGVSLRQDEGVWHGPRVGFGARMDNGWGLQALGQGALPSTHELEVVELEFCGGSLRLAGTYRHTLVRSVALEWFTGPGLEIVHYRVRRSLDPGVSPGRGDTEARPGIFAGLSGVFRHDSPRIAVTAECLAALTRTHYDVVSDDSRQTVGRAAPVVPSLGMCVRW